MFDHLTTYKQTQKIIKWSLIVPLKEPTKSFNCLNFNPLRHTHEATKSRASSSKSQQTKIWCPICSFFGPHLLPKHPLGTSKCYCKLKRSLENLFKVPSPCSDVPQETILKAKEKLNSICSKYPIEANWQRFRFS